MLDEEKTVNEYAEEVSNCIFDCNLNRVETRMYLQSILREMISDGQPAPNFWLYSVFQRIQK